MTRRTLLLAAAAGDVTAGLPDFSNCGYLGGGVKLPVVPVRAALKPAAGDATQRIQAALDALARQPRAQRGALLLERGDYEVAGTLKITASGIVLRGVDGTRILATGTKPRAVIEIIGAGEPRLGTPTPIVDDVVPVGARRFQVADAQGFRVGQRVVVRRQSNAAWIREIGMDRILARPGDPKSTRQWEPFPLDFERVITALDGRTVTVDAPLFCAIEQRWGGGTLLTMDDGNRIEQCGVEHLTGLSAFDRSVTAVYGREKEQYFSDEAHAHDFISIDQANDCWVRHVSARHFVFALVNIRRARQVTVEDCDNAEMVSVITGSRRYPFSITNGQRVLIRRCQSDTGRHDFVVGARVPGPNVFLDCRAGRSFAQSEPHHRWSVGGLYDNVKASIAVQDRQWMGTGHGWSGANYVLWNCEGPVVCQKPPTADNWVVGHIGDRSAGAFAPKPEASWRSFGTHVTPRSLYLHQLAARLKSR